MSALSIGIFTYSTKPRGSVVHAGALAEALTARGCDVVLYALDKDGLGFYRPLNSEVVLIPAQPAPATFDALIAARIRELAAYVDRVRPRHDIVHAEDCLTASALLRSAAMRRARLVRTVHHVERFESPYLEECQRRSILGADLCVAVSEATRRDLAVTYGRESAVVGNGVDIRRFAALSLPELQACRTRLQIDADERLVLSIGGVEPRKNTLNLLEGFLHARARGHGLRWVIAGGASIYDHTAYRAAFFQRLSQLSPQQCASITILGELPDCELTALIAAADVLLHASLHEGFGLAVLEAMAARTAVVVSRGAPFDEFVDGTCAEIVEPSDALSIARGLERASTSGPEQLERARGRARTHSWERVAARHESLYRSELARAPSRRSASSSPEPADA